MLWLKLTITNLLLTLDTSAQLQFYPQSTMNTNAYVLFDCVCEVLHKHNISATQIRKLVYYYIFEGTPTARILRRFVNRFDMSSDDFSLFPLLRHVETIFDYSTEDFEDEGRVNYCKRQYHARLPKMYNEFKSIEQHYIDIFGEGTIEASLEWDKTFLDVL